MGRGTMRSMVEGLSESVSPSTALRAVPLVSLICGRRVVLAAPRGAASGARKPATPLELQTAGELGAPGASSSTRTVARGSTPHTQGREWKMAQEEAFVGIDVSKAWLDVAVLPSGEAFRVA